MAFEIGKIQTVVGTGEGGYAGDGGPATQALIGEACGCDFDTEGNLYICDGRNHTVRRIDKDSGIIMTVAGSGRQGYSGDGGPATEATLCRDRHCYHHCRWAPGRRWRRRSRHGSQPVIWRQVVRRVTFDAAGAPRAP